MRILWAALGGILATLVGAAIGDLVSEEIRGRLDRLPYSLIRLAAHRLPLDVREDLTDEWIAELHVILRGAEAFPVTRLVRGIGYALGLLRVAPSISREITSSFGPQAAGKVAFARELRRRLAALWVLGEAIEVRTSKDDVDRLVHMLVRELHDLEELESTMPGSQRREALEDVDVLSTAQAAAQTVSLARNTQIRVDGSGRALRVRSNPTMLRQALENLMDNAATCGPGNPVDVVVRLVSRRLPGVEVLVADRGPGLGRAPASRRSGGVGLPFVRKFVQEAGGRLWCKDREGGGALFGLWLPCQWQIKPLDPSHP